MSEVSSDADIQFNELQRIKHQHSDDQKEDETCLNTESVSGFMNSTPFSSTLNLSVRMVTCVSNYPQSLITDNAANEPQSAARPGRQSRVGEGDRKVCAPATLFVLWENPITLFSFN